MIKEIENVRALSILALAISAILGAMNLMLHEHGANSEGMYMFSMVGFLGWNTYNALKALEAKLNEFKK